VAAEVRGERLVREREDLDAVAAVDELDERITGDLVGEPRAAAALDAALAIEQHQRADRDGLLEVPLLLDEAALAGSECQRLILERAFAAAVADRTVERVIDEEEFEDAVLGLLDDVRLGVDDHAVGDRQHARRLQGLAARTLDLDEAHAAHADG